MLYKKTFHMADGELNGKTLAAFIKEHKILRNRYDELEKLYKGEHPILSASPKEEFKPDNRIVANFAKYIVDTYNGYFMGIPLKVNCDNEVAGEALLDLKVRNDLDDTHAELSKKMSIYGHAYELVFTDESGLVGLVDVDPKECFLIRDNSIRERVVYGVRYTEAEDLIIGTISDAEKVIWFELKDENLTVTDEQEHFFGGVPIVEYIENEERLGVFESVETLINAYNKAISEKANDVDYFSDAYLAILGAVLEESDLNRLRDNRIINLASHDTDKMIVEFLEKPDSDATQEHLVDRLERLIFSLSMVPNMGDAMVGVSAASATSGIALKYKMLNMSNMAQGKERKFASGLNRRFALIANIPNSGIKQEDLSGITYKFVRNEPSDLAGEANVASVLRGLVSEATALSTLSVVSDVQAEMEKIEEERKLTAYDYEAK